jgi:predicted enzyme related to lactoylglutathione lyase
MGNPFVHIDLATTDVAAAKQFYAQVFDWKFPEMPGMDYVGVDPSGGTGGGMGKIQDPDGHPSWTSYVDVKDIDETLAKAVAAGATVVAPRMDVGGMGWIAMFSDPQGAVIGLWQSAAPPKPAPAPKKAAAKKPAPAKKAAAPAKKAAKKAAPAKKAAAKKPPAKKKR